MERKENDLMMNIIANPDFSINDFATVGLNMDNTSLQDELVYRGHPVIQLMFTDNETGKFNEKLFKDTYNTALIAYNVMGSDKFEQDQNAIFHRNNIFAPLEQRLWAPNFKQEVVSNPQRVTESIFRLGEKGPRTKSDDELAQAERVLLNPNEVYKDGKANWDLAQWGEAPEKDFWGYFTDTLVMAQYDEDGFHIDPITGQETPHYKGELMVGPNGTYFYEKLDGRPVYDKRVLSKFNVITEEDSPWHRFDIFDSDDIESSPGKTFLKNAFLVGSMFIPYVGPAIVGANILTQLVGITGTLGKMFTGSDSPIFSEMEGWAQSMDRLRAKSEYALQNTWCWENFINTIGDAAAQITEQRFLFTKLPALFKGGLVTEEALKTRQLSYADKIRSINNLLLGKMAASEELDSVLLKLQKSGLTNKGLINLKAKQMTEAWQKSYYKIGEIVSKGYMTAITVHDTYGEAKEAGATDIEATLLTLGYGAAEAWLLNTGIGEWLLPELRQEKAMMRKALNTKIKLTILEFRKEEGKQAAKDITEKAAKLNFAVKLFNKGKELFQGQFLDKALEQKGTVKALGNIMLASGIGEGVEEVSEEFLKDFAYGAFNTVNWLRGNDTKLSSFGFSKQNGEWKWSGKDMIDRYGMSLIGGFFGGMVAAPGQHFKSVAADMNNEQAHQYLTYLINEGKIDEVKKELLKTEIGDKTKSAYLTEIVNNVTVFKPGTEEDNQDLYAKKTILKYLDTVEEILNTDGSNLSEEAFLNEVLGDLKYELLYHSQTADRLLDLHYFLNSKIISTVLKIKELEVKEVDTNENGVAEDDEKRAARNKPDSKELESLKKELKEYQDQMKELFDKKNQYRYIGELLFEVIPELHLYITPVSKQMFVKHLFNGKTFEELTNELKQIANEEFNKWNALDRKEQIHRYSNAFMDALEAFSNRLDSLNKNYLTLELKSKDIISLVTGMYEYLNRGENAEKATEVLGKSEIKVNLAQILDPDTHNSIVEEQQRSNLEALTEYEDNLKQIDPALSEAEKTLKAIDLKDQYNTKLKKIDKTYKKKVDNIVYKNIRSIAEDFIKLGFANHEVRQLLSRILTDASYNFSIDRINELYEEYQKMTVDDLRKLYPDLNDQQLNDLYNDIQDMDKDMFENEIINPRGGDLQIIEFKQMVETFKKLPDSPWEQLLDEFALSIDREPIRFSQLLAEIDTVINNSKNDFSLLNISDDLANRIKEAVKVIQLVQTAMHASKTDDFNPNNIFGYTKTLNEVLQKNGFESKYAEIDSNFAEVLILDLENASLKIQFVWNLFNLNKGNKAVMQQKVEGHVCKQILKKFRAVVQVRDEELEKLLSFIKLKNYLTSDDNFKIIGSDTQAISKEDRKKLRKEIVGLFDAVYDFYLEIVKDPDNLSRFLNVERFNPFVFSNTSIADLTLDNIDNAVTLLLFNALGALKYSDFLSLYKTVISTDTSEPILPIFSQELAVFLGYANLINGLLIADTNTIFNNNIVNSWINADSTQKFNWLKTLGLSLENAKELSENADYNDVVLSGLPLVRYDTIALIEGVAGSGKTSVVLKSIYKLLNKYFPNDNFDKAWVIHCSDLKISENGKPAVAVTTLGDKIILNLGILNGLAFVINEILEKICSDKEYLNRISDSKKIQPGDYIFDKYRFVTTKDINTSLLDVPPVIFIDEIGKLNELLLDLLRKFSEYYGVTILTLGDFDLVKNTLEFSYNVNNTKLKPQATTRDSSFSTSLKIGSCMRTDNNVKADNNNVYQNFKNKGHKGTLYLKVFEKEDGNIYGDKIISALDPVNDIIATIKKVLPTLEDNEKITFISQGGKLELALLNDSDIKDRLEIVTEQLAQGRENRYYIVEITTDPLKLNNNTEHIHDVIYTGVTRAQQGSFLIIPPGLNIELQHAKELIPDRNKENFVKVAQDTVDILSELYPHEATFTLVRRKKKTILQQQLLLQQLQQLQHNPVTKILTDDEARNKYGDSIFLQKLPFEYNGFNYEVDFNPFKIETVFDNGDKEVVKSPIFTYDSNGSSHIVTTLKIGNAILPFRYDGNKWLPMMDYKTGATLTANVDEFNNTIDSALQKIITIPPELPKLTDLQILENLQIPADPAEFALYKQDIINSLLPLHKITPEEAKYKVGDSFILNDSLHTIVDFNIVDNEYEYTLRNSTDGSTITYKESDININEIYRLVDSLDSLPFKKNDEVSYKDRNYSIELFYKSFDMDNNPLDLEMVLIKDLETNQIAILDNSEFENIKELEVEKRPEDSDTIEEIYEGTTSTFYPPVRINDETVYFDFLNELLEKKSPIPTVEEPVNDEALPLPMMLFSLNVLETGAIWDHGKYVLDEQDFIDKHGKIHKINVSELRIDGANGLMKLRELILTDPSADQRTKDLYRLVNLTEQEWTERKIARMQEILLKTEDPSEILLKLKTILGYDFDIINWGFVANPVFSKTQSLSKINDYASDDFTSAKDLLPFSTNKNERLAKSISDDIYSDSVQAHKLVALIGKNGTEMIQIPILSLNNPVTLMHAPDANGNKPFQQVADFWDSLPANDDFHTKCDKTIEKFENTPAYKNLINLFKLFRKLLAGFARINDPSNPNDPYKDWTPARNLIDHGLFVTKTAGKYHEEEGWLINKKNGRNTETSPATIPHFFTIDKFLKDPRYRVSDYVMVAPRLDGELNEGMSHWVKNSLMKNPAKWVAGHPFVLVGTNEFTSDEDMARYYEAQFDPNSEEHKHPKVELLQVLPPEATFEEYINSILRRWYNLPETREIGHIFVPLLLLNILLKDDTIKNLIKQIYPKNPDYALGVILELVDKINTRYNEFSETRDGKDWKSKRDKAVKELLKLDYKDTFGNYFLGSSGSNISCITTILARLATNNTAIDRMKYDADSINNINRILKENKYTIFYRGNIILQGNLTINDGKFVVVNLDSINGKSLYTINGKPYKMSGKIDTTTMSIENFGGLLDHILTRLDNFYKQGTPLKSGKPTFPYRDKYFKNKSPERKVRPNKNVTFISDTISRLNNLKRIDPTLNIDNNVLMLWAVAIDDDTDVNALNQFADNHKQRFIDEIVASLLQSNPKKLIFTIGDNIKITNDEVFSDTSIIYNGDIPVTDIKSFKVPMLGNTYEFTFKSNGKIYKASFDATENILTYFDTTPIESSVSTVLNIDSTAFDNFMANIELAEDDFDKLNNYCLNNPDHDLNLLLTVLENSKSFEEYFENLSGWPLIESDSLQEIDNFINSVLDVNFKNLLTEIRNILVLDEDERATLETVEKEMNDVKCPRNLQIKVH